jgi:hypothetical protein
MKEAELDTAINALTQLRQTFERPEVLDPAIKALKEFRQKRVHWKTLVKGVRTVQRVQRRNLKDTDALIEALLQ